MKTKKSQKEVHMQRKYDLKLVEALQGSASPMTLHGAPVLLKPIPDKTDPGEMDPRLAKDMRNALLMMRFVPNGLMKMDLSPKGIAKLRLTFNAVKGIPIVTRTIEVTNASVIAEDGYEIPIRLYTTSTMTDPQPVLYYIHGGGFFAGHPEVVEESVKLIVERYDFPVVSVDYRLAPENPFPVGHDDVFKVYRWILDHAQEFHGDPKRVFVGGDSAGGNLAQSVSTRAYENKLTPVKGQLLLYPTLNMACVEDEFFHWSIDQFEMSKKHKAAIKGMLGLFGNMGNGMAGLLGVEDIKNDLINPYTRDPHQNPPTFLAVGEHDYLKVETLAYAAKLHSVGIPTKTLVYKGMGHAFFDQCGIYPQCEDLAIEMGKFIKEQT